MKRPKAHERSKFFDGQREYPKKQQSTLAFNGKAAAKEDDKAEDAKIKSNKAAGGRNMEEKDSRGQYTLVQLTTQVGG